MKVVFKDDHFAFELVRNLGFMYYGGSDLGEMVATAEQIVEGDFEDWFAKWDARARRTLSRADESLTGGHLVSARQAYLRASTYFRMSEFYLHGNPDDPRILASMRASQKAYTKAAELTGSTWEHVEIPYEGTTLPGYFYKPDDSGKRRPTVIFHGGYDSSLEELFYYGGAPSILRGYNCLTFDGPGQGAPMREQKLPFRYDWEKVVTPAVDYALTRSDVDGDNLILIGMSLGGYLAARAVAFEHRFKAAVFFDGVYDLYDSMRKLLPAEAISAYEAGDRDACQRIVEVEMHKNTPLKWNINQGTWSFSVPDAAGILDTSKQYTLRDIANQIQCACLVMEAEDDIFFTGQPERVYDELKAPKTFARFTAKDGAENHCQSGALSYKDEVVFNWIDATLKSPR
ncbi:alpha/beta hydrolase family protein [Methylobacterium nonmethylotrophicum]|uniref:Alpha/beta hydrolase n=1 Tax=Methylobacterium nonmethylotrophicum TaxID=1141884 RepID=A0A4Z0NR98_9HYPH|nr:alpha/beta fold hydrolase [Methylobacterium nonmethylotrophicum]TGD99671.1 alpha/beta hydrolase [Methylobacterium nonmethylotrophicum]